MRLSSKLFLVFFLITFLFELIEPCPLDEEEEISGSGCSSQNISFAKTELEGRVEMREPRHGNMSCPDSQWTIQPGGPNSAIRITFSSPILPSSQPSSFQNVDMILMEDGQKKKVSITGLVHWHYNRQSRILNLNDTLEFESRPNQGIEFICKSVSGTSFEFAFTRVTVSDRSCICPKFYYAATSEWQDISSPNYPKKHCPDIKCFYYLEANKPNQAVELDFDAMKFDTGHDIRLTTVTFPVRELLSWWKNDKRRSQTFNSSSNPLVLLFAAQMESEGWHAKFRAIHNPCPCPEKLAINGTGNLTSPGYPDHGCYTKCTYELEAPPGKDIHVTFIPSSIVYWNSPENSIKWVVDSELSLVQHSSRFSISIQQYGNSFILEYEVLSPTKGCQCQNQPQILESLSGSVSAPKNSTSGSYCRPLDCFYLLKSPKRDHQHLKITYHGKTAKWDYFKATSYNNAFHRIQAKPTEHHDPLINTHNGVTDEFDCTRSVVLQFHSDRRNSEANEMLTWEFNFEWKVCNCGPAHYQATSSPQSLTSPLFPDHYCNGLDCQWLLEAPPGHRIVFEIHQNDLRGNDYLIIYDGQYPSAHAARYVGQHQPDIINSSHHYMTVKFRSDSSVSGMGFNATFYAESLLNETHCDQKFWAFPAWNVAGPIFLAIIFLIISCACLVFYRKYLHEKICQWWENASRSPLVETSAENDEL